MKRVQLRHDQLAAERAFNVRNELNKLVTAHRQMHPNTRIATTRKAIAKYYHQIHGYPIPGR